MKQGRISTSQIAEICGVSQGTVDRALHDRKGISYATKEKILAVAKEYGYRSNAHARIMAGGKSMTIGVIVFDLNNQYFSDILRSIGYPDRHHRKPVKGLPLRRNRQPAFHERGNRACPALRV